MAVALIVSQTPWFKDWLRRYIVRESKQYLNGELSIGTLGGNLFFGVQLADVAVDVSGERVIAVKALELDYNALQLISRGIVLDQIKLDQPQLKIEHDAQGWNLARLVRKQEKEADREGPGRSVSMPLIQITDATVSIRDAVGTSGFELPRQVQDVDIKAGFRVRARALLDRPRASQLQRHGTGIRARPGERKDRGARRQHLSRRAGDQHR